MGVTEPALPPPGPDPQRRPPLLPPRAGGRPHFSSASRNLRANRFAGQVPSGPRPGVPSAWTRVRTGQMGSDAARSGTRPRLGDDRRANPGRMPAPPGRVTAATRSLLARAAAGLVPGGLASPVRHGVRSGQAPKPGQGRAKNTKKNGGAAGPGAARPEWTLWRTSRWGMSEDLLRQAARSGEHLMADPAVEASGRWRPRPSSHRQAWYRPLSATSHSCSSTNSTLAQAGTQGRRAPSWASPGR